MNTSFKNDARTEQFEKDDKLTRITRGSNGNQQSGNSSSPADIPNRSSEAEQRRKKDEEYTMAFARRLGELFPGCPYDEQMTIAEHACRRNSGRVGRSAGANAFHYKTINLAVRAHIRHIHTDYDDLLRQGVNRYEARELVEEEVLLKLIEWQNVFF